MRFEKADVVVVATVLNYWFNQVTGEHRIIFHDAAIKSRNDVRRGTNYRNGDDR
jgi:hypothetical protein